MMKKIGFVDVKYYGLTAANYPWITSGHKP